ncbi:MAG: hypothetical protein Q8P51_15170, partial [Ignavibacteria bacterium]|nr:hypothetical protein [Ignavibacteria bacterium]
VKLAPVFFTLAELKRNLKSSFVKQLLKEGKILVGQLPKEIARGNLSTMERISADQRSLTLCLTGMRRESCALAAHQPMAEKRILLL